MPSIDRDGRTLAYETYGDQDGCPVVLHHGTPGSRLDGRLLAEAARATGVRLVSPDRPGVGRSDPAPGRTIGDWRDDCRALLSAVDADRAALLAYSGGAPFALAASDLDEVAGACLVSGLAPGADLGVLGRLAPVPGVLRAWHGLLALAVRFSGPDAVAGQFTDREVDEETAASVAASVAAGYRQGTAAAAREGRLFAAAGSADPDVPLRAFHGTADGNAPLSAVRRLCDRADGHLTAPDADHLGTLLDARADALSWCRAQTCSSRNSTTRE